MAAPGLRTLIALCFSSLILFTAPLASAQFKIAVVDMQRAISDTEDGLRAQATLKKLFDRRNAELNSLRDQLKRDHDDLEKQARVLSKEALDRRRAELEERMVALQSRFQEANAEAQAKQNELTQPILHRMQSVLRQLASQEGYELIFDRAAVPYVRTDLDITDKVIQRYNTGGSAPAAPPADTRPTPPAAPKPSAAPPATPPRPAPTGSSPK